MRRTCWIGSGTGHRDEGEKAMGAIEERKLPDRIPKKEWSALGRKLFGKDPRKWKFVCACCGHVQTIGDFIELRDLGLWDGDAQIAYHNCIGRYDTRIKDKDIGRLDGRGKSPCDYTLGGLFCLAKTFVVDEDGNEHAVFEFAEEESEKETVKERRIHRATN